MPTTARRKKGPAPDGLPGGSCRAARVRTAFSLVELLVVIAVISLLTSVLLPSLQRAKELSRQTVCLHNQKAIGLAAIGYVSEHGSYPPAWQGSNCRWMDLLKPFASKRSKVYSCPSDLEQIPLTWDPEIILSYGINCFRFADRAHCFWYGVKADDVPRPGDTILFADCTPGKYYCGGGNRFYEPVVDVDYRHLDGSFCAAFCDGHADALKTTERDHWDASR